jgi:predicted glycogen debranching enzyme
MEKLIRRIELPQTRDENAKTTLRQQWLIGNGLGGYASGTIAGGLSWRYHGLLIAALPAPFGRTLLLNYVNESLLLPNGQWRQIGGTETSEEGDAPTCIRPVEFRIENSLPIWRYEVDGVTLEKQILLLHGQNTVHINYRLLSKQELVKFQIRPWVHFRGHEQPVSLDLKEKYVVTTSGQRYEISTEAFPPLRLLLRADNVSMTSEAGMKQEMFYEKESERGFEARGILFSPGFFQLDLTPRKSSTLIASAESWDRMSAITPEEALQLHDQRCEHLISLADSKARTRPASDLVLAADQFIIKPVGRVADSARANASGDEVRTVIAGYHWFTDWGRDTMISLEGLTLTTGRFTEAGWILRTFARHIRDGLIPNMFPESEHEGLYHTADATLWFFHALDRYLEYTNDRTTLRALLPKLLEIVEHHLRGTRFGIHVDPKDGLLCQGAEGYQLTWMDAKVDNWVVTPRRGKAVEINALWFNALRLLEDWLREEENEDVADRIAKHAQQTFDSFNKRFWITDKNYLYDVIDGESGDDTACRPNQVMAISLKYPVLDPKYWKPVLETARDRLLTPVGLRSLSRDHRDYKSRYFGDLRARDAAYHQGTVWAWLVGPFIDAWLKTFPEDRETPRSCLSGFVSHLNEACIGSISEIFDAEPPFTPRGCIAQAWSVAEVLRCMIKTARSSDATPMNHQDLEQSNSLAEIGG